MRYDIKILSEYANRLGVVRNTLEKVLRLAEILRFINSNEFLKNKLALKGGTAINLLYSNLPRLSVDIDFDYTLNQQKEDMQIVREMLKNELKMYFLSEGYVLSKNSRFSFALDAFFISYISSGGGTDNIKIEINYLMRNHLLPLEHRLLDLSVIDNPFYVLTISKIEIYAGKINALLSRNQIRDLYDTYQMINNYLLNKDEIIILQRIVLFYRYIQNESFDYNQNFIEKYTRKNYVRDLLPVIKKGDLFALDFAKEIVGNFIEKLTTYNNKQKAFIDSIIQNNPSLELLFDDNEMLKQAKSHPLVIRKLNTI